ncbi:hypothetical protein [Pseudomonas knackmussii]|uniref:hypothetical protein n=1 Tax=Pseudomonas knackmussii TaxID=65741 RepID=UPI001363096C|nr:hypothetical protein [Pseudomonas knackmussii]
MKRALYVAAAGLLLLVPWAQHRVAAAQPSICSGESELFALSARGAIHYQGSMTYRPEPQGRALMRFVGDFDVGDGRHYHVNRTAEVRSEVVEGQARLVTLSASRSFADDAPDDLVRRYVHPALEAGAQYDVKLFDLAAGTLASGSELSPRNLCTIRNADA